MTARESDTTVVCAACGRKSCWDGVLMCEDARAFDICTRDEFNYAVRRYGLPPTELWARGINTDDYEGGAS